jgi:hypothetical protein
MQLKYVLCLFDDAVAQCWQAPFTCIVQSIHGVAMPDG